MHTLVHIGRDCVCVCVYCALMNSTRTAVVYQLFRYRFADFPYFRTANILRQSIACAKEVNDEGEKKEADNDDDETQ